MSSKPLATHSSTGPSDAPRHEENLQISAQMRAYDFHKVIDNGLVDRLVKEGFFESVFGPDVKAEEDRKAKLAFR